MPNQLNYEIIPEHMREATRMYIEDGCDYLSDALFAIFSNNLSKFTTWADDTNLAAVREWGQFLKWEVPAACWGSAEKITKWQKQGGLKGQTSLT